jgi:hypothetical protein
LSDLGVEMVRIALEAGLQGAKNGLTTEGHRGVSRIFDDIESKHGQSCGCAA